jgi:hypothetical protein
MDAALPEVTAHLEKAMAIAPYAVGPQASTTTRFQRYAMIPNSSLQRGRKIVDLHFSSGGRGFLEVTRSDCAQSCRK